MSQGKILVVDNELDIVALYERTLKGAGYTVERALSGEEGWEKCQQTRYDVILTDWRMGKLSGLDLYKKVEATYPATEVIIITGFGDDFKREVDQGRYKVDLLQKPVQRQSLLNKVKSAMDDLVEKKCPLIITEGKTDWKHLKAALRWLQARGQATVAALAFREYGDEVKMGDAELLNLCKQMAKLPQSRITICLFDRDNKAVSKEVAENENELKGYKAWGNNVYSLILPVPEHRRETPDVCIELYYKDEEIKRCDSNGRRLYLGEEFNPRSGRHNEDNGIICRYTKDRMLTVKIIDSEVFNEKHENIALPKSDFAQSVLDEVENFNDFDFTAFSAVFALIEKISRDASGQGK